MHIKEQIRPPNAHSKTFSTFMFDYQLFVYLYSPFHQTLYFDFYDQLDRKFHL